MHVFLSYSRKDGAFVKHLADDLARGGIDVWLDTEDLDTTDEDRWRRSIVKAIRDSAAIVVVLSPDSVKSGAVERELTIAAETTRRIIPLAYRPCELPDGFLFELAGVQRVDFAEQPYDLAFDQLIRRIGAVSTVASSALPLPSKHSTTPSVDPVVAHQPITSPPVVAPKGIEESSRTGAEHPFENASDSAIGPADRTMIAPSAPVAAAPAPGQAPATFQLDPAVTVADSRAPGELPPKGVLAGRGRRAKVMVALAVGVVVVGIAGVIAAWRGDGGNADGTSSQATEVVATNARAVNDPGPVSNSSEPISPSSIATAPVAVTETAAPEGSGGPSSVPSSGSSLAVATESSTALAIIDALQVAYNARDWETVRRINANQADWSDDDFVAGYGSADRVPRLEQGFHVILQAEATGVSSWQVVGTILAWDYNADASQSTNVACAEWDVNATDGTAAQSGIEGSDGKTSRRLDGWLDEEHFDATAAEYCE